MVLPLATLTTWIWTGSLCAFARVCRLRLDSHAQAETRVIAESISGIAVQYFPYAWRALL
jgi:thymidylate synthase (FAD)